MRRRLFWTIAGVAAITGLLVLIGGAIASQRAAVEATRRELVKSSHEVVGLIEDAVRSSETRPGAIVEVFRILEGDLGPLMGRIRRTAGGSDLAFAAVGPDGRVRANDPLFDRIEFDVDELTPDSSVSLTSSAGEMVVLTPTQVPTRSGEILVLVALARESPVVRLRDIGGGFLFVAAGMLLVSAVLARVLSNQVVSRLEPLSDASRRLAGGDLSARVPDLGDPDLDTVGRSFNEMASDLESSREREREFLLGVGHDLRTPLTTIAGYAEALESEGIDSTEVARIGGVLGAQSRQLGRLIEDLTLLARLEQPEFSLRREKVDVGAHIGEVVAGFQRTASRSGVNLTVSAEDGLTMETDPDRLVQITQNLIENALRYTPEPGRVDVIVRRVEDGVELSVTDTGVGIEPDDLPHIFDRHYIGRQRSVRNQGSGLGLSIVSGLAGRLGGKVTAESSPGKGTTIVVRLKGVV